MKSHLAYSKKKAFIFFLLALAVLILLFLIFMINNPYRALTKNLEYVGYKDAEVNLIYIGRLNSSYLDAYNLVKQIADEYPEDLKYALVSYSPTEEERLYAATILCAKSDRKERIFYDYILNGAPTRPELFMKATELKMNIVVFQDCLDEEVFIKKIDITNNQIEKANLDNTPVFIVNGNKFFWPVSTENLRLVVEKELL